MCVGGAAYIALNVAEKKYEIGNINCIRMTKKNPFTSKIYITSIEIKGVN
jgi:hypothetical protein